MSSFLNCFTVISIALLVSVSVTASRIIQQDIQLIDEEFSRDDKFNASLDSADKPPSPNEDGDICCVWKMHLNKGCNSFFHHGGGGGFKTPARNMCDLANNGHFGDTKMKCVNRYERPKEDYVLVWRPLRKRSKRCYSVGEGMLRLIGQGDKPGKKIIKKFEAAPDCMQHKEGFYGNDEGLKAKPKESHIASWDNASKTWVYKEKYVAFDGLCPV